MLAIVFFKILTDTFWLREGNTEGVAPLAKIGDEKTKQNECNINIKFPNYNIEQKLYDNDNNYLVNNFINIERAANPLECKEIISV